VVKILDAQLRCVAAFKAADGREESGAGMTS
jgi:hypothetical protein